MSSRSGARLHVEGDRAYILHAQPYRESSLILDVFTRDHGKLGIIARGARRPRSTMRTVLMAFQPLEAAWFGTGELKTLKSAEWLGGLPALAGTSLFLGYYLNELLVKLLPREDAHPGLFLAYEQALQALVSGEATAVALRAFELNLLRELGYGLDLAREAITGAPLRPDDRYLYDPEQGLIRIADDARPMGSGSPAGWLGRHLQAIDQGDLSDAATRVVAKQLMRQIIQHQLGGQTLESRRIFKEVFDV